MRNRAGRSDNRIFDFTEEAKPLIEARQQRYLEDKANQFLIMNGIRLDGRFSCEAKGEDGRCCRDVPTLFVGSVS